MTPKSLTPAILVICFALLAGCASAAGQPALNPAIQQALNGKYPGLKLVKSCEGRLLGRDASALAVLRNEAKKEFLVVWVISPEDIQELDAVQTDPELQCMDAKEAKEREHDVHHTETIVGTLKARKGQGAACYFIDNTTAKCWTVDRSTGRLVEIGGWQT